MKHFKISISLFLLVFVLSICSVFSQSYTDQEIGFNEASLIQILIDRGIPAEDIPEIISLERALHTEMYQSMLNIENQTPSTASLTILSAVNSSALTTANTSTLVDCGISATEKQALIDLYDATGGDNWTNSWDITGDVCNWYGVTIVNGIVTRLILISNNLNGFIPESIGNLTSLTDLDLQNNDLDLMPESIGNLTSLTYLNLQSNDLDLIPESIGNLTNLTRLSLAVNNLVLIPESIWNLTSLTYLNLQNTQFSGPIPDSIGNLTNLTSLSLADNNLVLIPESIWNLTSLTNLNLKNNQFSGPIPDSIGNLTSLTSLYLQNNQFSGSIPDSIRNLTNLQYLDINNCNLEGTIPSGIGELSSLYYLDLGDNTSFSQGSIPEEFGNLTNLQFLRLQNCNLSGSIPSSLGNLSNLLYFYMPYNNLSGPIPDTLGDLSSLLSLTLMSNNLSGPIPNTLGNLSNLTSIALYSNDIDGEIPEELKNLSNLQRLYLGDNNLSGRIPDFTGLIDLTYLSFNSNNFVFSDFESEHPIYNANVTSFYSYYPQAKVDQVETIIVNVGDPLNLTTTALTSASNNYQWQYSSNGSNWADVGLDASTFTIASVTEADAGYYRFFATNDVIDNLTLERNVITVITNNGASVEEIICLSGTSINPSRDNDSNNTLKLEIIDGSEILSLSATITNAIGVNDIEYDLNRSFDEFGELVFIVKGASAYKSFKIVYNIVTSTETYVSDGTWFDADTIVDDSVFSGPIIANFECPVTQDPSSEVCLTNFLDENEEEYIGLELSLLDGSLISFISAKITKANNLEEFVVDIEDIPFDSNGELDYSLNYNPVGFNFTGLWVEYEIHSSSGIHQGEEYIEVSHLENLGEGYLRIFECTPYTSSDTNKFCANQLDDDPTVANLTPSGSNILWYASETGGESYNTDDYIIDEAYDEGGTTYWWDDTTDGITSRTASTIEIFLDIEGDTEQVFSKFASPAPTLADIEVYNGEEQIYWYASDSSTTTLNTNTPLDDGVTYYASSCDSGDDTCYCRLPVTVTIGVLPPEGELAKYLCESTTLDDVFEPEDQTEIIWYDSEEEGNVLTVTTVVEDGAIYYAAQREKGGDEEESSTRLPVVVFIVPSVSPVIIENEQTFYANHSPTISYLRADAREEVLWYSQPVEGTLYDPTYPLEDGGVYYAEVSSGCTTTRIPVTVTIEPEKDEPLYGCEMFRPELGQDYVIDAWVNERQVITETLESIPFNDSEESEMFVALLNHLKNRFMSKDKFLHDIPSEYAPVFTADEVQYNLGPLMAYIDGAGTGELIVYDFSAINDDYGRAIGFSFYLSANDRGTGSNQFIYRTPTFTHTIPDIIEEGITQITITEHFPLMDNEAVTLDEQLNFTKVKVDDDDDDDDDSFIMYADYNHSGEIVSQTESSSSNGLVKSAVTLNKYTEVAYQATPHYTNTSIEISFIDEQGNTISTTAFSTHGLVIDKWQKITGNFSIPNNAGRLKISLKNSDESKVAYFDDLRIYPYESNIKTFVYHPENQRLMSELDENNYATFYEYDKEGGLIRVKKETVKGTYTIQETRSGNVKATN